jgi:hypothetical protein
MEREVIIGNLREKEFLRTLEDQMKKHPDWAISVELESKGWFRKTWKIGTANRYQMTNLMRVLDDL